MTTTATDAMAGATIIASSVDEVSSQCSSGRCNAINVAKGKTANETLYWQSVSDSSCGDQWIQAIFAVRINVNRFRIDYGSLGWTFGTANQYFNVVINSGTARQQDITTLLSCINANTTDSPPARSEFCLINPPLFNVTSFRWTWGLNRSPGASTCQMNVHQIFVPENTTIQYNLSPSTTSRMTQTSTVESVPITTRSPATSGSADSPVQVQAIVNSVVISIVLLSVLGAGIYFYRRFVAKKKTSQEEGGGDTSNASIHLEAIPKPGPQSPSDNSNGEIFLISQAPKSPGEVHTLLGHTNSDSVDARDGSDISTSGYAPRNSTDKASSFLNQLSPSYPDDHLHGSRRQNRLAEVGGTAASESSGDENRKPVFKKKGVNGFPASDTEEQSELNRQYTRQDGPNTSSSDPTSSKMLYGKLLLPKDPTYWTVEDSVAWLSQEGVAQEILDAVQAHEIDGLALLRVDVEIFGITVVGRKIRLEAALEKLRAFNLAVMSEAAPPEY